MEDIKTLREYIRGTLREAKVQQKKKLRLERMQEFKLRKVLRSIIKESENIVTHESTGINVLADLLETIVPILKSFYKKLGTDVSQRKSFRAHTIKGVQNLLAPVALMFKAGGTAGSPETMQKPKSAEAPIAATGAEETDTELFEQDEEVEGPESDPAFIPTKEVEKEKEEQEPQDPTPEDAFEPIEGEDETGRNIALQSFKRVEKQIREAYSLLANEDDRTLFYDYLITNLKLYFDKFEDELQSTVPEPTTQEYEAEKQQKQSSLAPTAAPVAAPQAETPAPEELE